MKTKITLLLLFIVSLKSFAQFNNKNLTLATEPVAVKFTYGNMRMYPVYANEAFLKSNINSHNFTTLKDAMDKKKIKVSEKNSRSEGAEVNSLTLENLSNDTVMILGGEVIEGGKQDRMIASDVIIPPHKKNVNLKVYCVEHGRWTTNTVGANAYNFSSSEATPVASPTIRKAGTVNMSQSEVWDQVKNVTDKNACKTSTGAYTALKTDSTYLNKINGYRVFFSTLLKSDPKIIGAVFVTGNRIIGCDLFASHSLMLKYTGNLVNSYATEAVSNGQKVAIPYATVQSYTNKLLSNEKEQEKLIKENGTMLKQNGSKIHVAFY